MSDPSYFDRVSGYITTWINEVGEQIDQTLSRINALMQTNPDDKSLAKLNRELKTLEDNQADLLACRTKLNTPPRGMKRIEQLSPEDTFDGYIQKLHEDPDFALGESRKAELGRIAALLQTYRLYQLNVFADGESDSIISSAEQMDLWQELQAEGNTLLDDAPKDEAERTKIAWELMKRLAATNG